MSLVVPGFLIGAGISLGTGVQSLVVGLTRRVTRLYVAFGALCFLLAAVLYFVAVYYSSWTLEGAAAAVRGHNLCTNLAFPAFFVFVSAYTGQEKPRGLSLVLLFYGVLAVVSATQPYGFRYVTFVQLPPLELPWGERLPTYGGEPSIWNAIVRIGTLLLFGWAFWRASVQYRSGQRRRALLLGFCFVLQVLSLFWSTLIDFGAIRSFYGAPLAFLTLVLLMSVSMGIDLREQNGLIRRSATEWKETFDSVRTPILVIDSFGRIVRGNRAACEVSRRDAISGEMIGSLGSGEPWQTATQLVAHIAGARGATSTEKKDAAGRTWDINIAHFSSERDSHERFILVLWDITGIVELQESVRRNERMSAIGAIVVGVAHEVRNPLFGISATLDAYANELEQPEYRECAEALRGEVARLKLVMHELLEYGKPTVAIEIAAVAEVVDAAIAGRGTRELPVQVVSNVSPSLPRLLMDKGRMRQVFENLIDNAAQHSPENGVVRIDARMIEQAGRNWIECSVADSGPGFSEEDMVRLWEPFYTRREGGTGLGLPLVQRIIEEHAGSIIAGNGADGGAMIRMRLPIVEAR